MHILGGLEKDSNTGAISTDPENHNLMCRLRAEKVAKIPVPDVEVQGCADDADLLIVGFGGTYGHLYSAMEEMNKAGKKGGPRPLHLSEPAPQEHGSCPEEVQEGGSCRTEPRTIRKLSAHEDRQLHPVPIQRSERTAVRRCRAGGSVQ